MDADSDPLASQGESTENQDLSENQGSGEGGAALNERIFLVCVDDSVELRAALRYASLRARNTGGRVALLYVMEPVELQNWMFVGSLMQEEQREEAERILQRHAATVSTLSGRTPIIYLRDGDRREELLKLLEEEPGLSILVLATGPESDGPGPLVNTLIGKMGGRLPIPMTLVPGSLSDDEIDDLT